MTDRFRETGSGETTAFGKSIWISEYLREGELSDKLIDPKGGSDTGKFTKF